MCPVPFLQLLFWCLRYPHPDRLWMRICQTSLEWLHRKTTKCPYSLAAKLLSSRICCKSRATLTFCCWFQALEIRCDYQRQPMTHAHLLVSPKNKKKITLGMSLTLLLLISNQTTTDVADKRRNSVCDKNSSSKERRRSTYIKTCSCDFFVLLL